MLSRSFDYATALAGSSPSAGANSPAVDNVSAYRSAYSPTMRSSVKYDSTYSRHDWGVTPRLRARSASWSTELQMYPETPSRTISGTDPPGRANTGVPQAMASIMTRPNGSSH